MRVGSRTQQTSTVADGLWTQLGCVEFDMGVPVSTHEFEVFLFPARAPCICISHIMNVRTLLPLCLCCISSEFSPLARFKLAALTLNPKP